MIIPGLPRPSIAFEGVIFIIEGGPDVFIDYNAYVREGGYAESFAGPARGSVSGPLNGFIIDYIVFATTGKKDTLFIIYLVGNAELMLSNFTKVTVDDIEYTINQINYDAKNNITEIDIEAFSAISSGDEYTLRLVP